MPEILGDATAYWLEQIHALLSPDPAWPTAKCHECGYWAPMGKYKETHCRKYPNARINDPACPAFVRRPKEAEDDTPR